MVPSRLFVFLMLAPVVVAVLALMDPAMVWVMLALDAGILVFAGVDALVAWSPKVSARRRAREVFSIGKPNVVEVEVRSNAGRRMRAQLMIDLFEHATSDELPLQVKLPRRGRETVKFRVTPRKRGSYTMGDMWIRYPSPLGLWQRQVKVPASDPVRVYPDVEQVREFELLARQDRQHSMMRTSRKLGGESEFEQLREYTRDDEFRSIDWKATARRGQLIARQYQLESNQNLMFMLDAGRLMSAEADGIGLFDHALNATLMLAHVANRGGDQVGLMTFDHEVRTFVPPAGGRGGVQRIVRATYDQHADLVQSDYEVAFEQLALRVRKRTLLVLFTQIVDDVAAMQLVRLTRSVMRRHLALIVLFRDADVDALMVRETGQPADLYVRGAAAEMIGWRENRIRQLKNAGALVLDVRHDDLTANLINRYLEIKARHLL